MTRMKLAELTSGVGRIGADNGRLVLALYWVCWLMLGGMLVYLHV
jgi:hypothetical protein